MGTLFYRSAKLVGGSIQHVCVRKFVLGANRAILRDERAGGAILACTHLSHLEPFIVGAVVPRRIRWMSRIEFYRSRLATIILNAGGAFPVDRFNHPLPAVRTAIRLVEQGHITGIFPEGGVATGRDSVIRGGPIKQGVCTIAIRTRTPVIPVVILGTHTLNRFRAWLPIRGEQVWVAFGQEVPPPPRATSRRVERAEMTTRLREEFVRAYQTLLREADLRDDQFP